jgi:uncharacterized protein
MSDSTADVVLAPTAPGERIHTLDVLRGFALLGIALVNVEFFSRPLQDINAPGIDPATSGADYFVEWLTYFFVQGKFWTMFALLFGMGFTVMIDRADRAGRPFVPAYLRRSLALLGIGLVHTVLVWSGDILVSYAVGALLLLLARQVRRAWLRRSQGREPAPMTASRMGGWGAALYGLPLVVILLAGMLDSPPSTSQPTRAQTEHATRIAEKAVQRANCRGGLQPAAASRRRRSAHRRYGVADGHAADRDVLGDRPVPDRRRPAAQRRDVESAGLPALVAADAQCRSAIGLRGDGDQHLAGHGLAE